MQYKWLVTLKPDTNIAEFVNEAKGLGCEPSKDEHVVPMTGGECVIQLAASIESRDELKKLPSVSRVSPSSEMGYH